MTRRPLALAVMAALACVCGQRPAFMRTQTAHEAYTDSLRKAGLHVTALGQAWIDAADAALRDAQPTALPANGYVLRVQPELLRSATLTIAQRTTPALTRISRGRR